MIKALVKSPILYAILLCVMFFFLALFSVEGFDWKNLKYGGSAITADESAHISAGYYYLKTGKYFINPEHPPLIKDIAGIPLLFLNPTLPNISDDRELYISYLKNENKLVSFDFPRELEVLNYQWDWGHVFLFNPNNDPDLITFWSRLSVIFFNATFLFLLYLFLSRLWNSRAALVALFLIIISQFNIAHGSLVTMDFMSSVLQIIVIASFSLYMKSFVIEKKNFKLLCLTILFLSLALLSKFSAIILIPTLFLGGFIYVFFSSGSWKKVGFYFVRFSTILVSTLILVSVFYYFHTKNMGDDDMIRQIVYTYPTELPWNGAELLASLIIGNPITKGLAEYINGVLSVVSRMNYAEQLNYFMYHYYSAEGAGLSYFPILYLTKTPIGMLFLSIFCGVLSLGMIFKKKRGLEESFRLLVNENFSLILMLFVYLYIATTLSSNLQIGLRHIFPVILAISILSARAIDVLWEKSLWQIIKVKFVFFIISIWLIISTLISFPYYLSYYNFLGGGTDNGYAIATDSNYDWGQDVKLFTKWVIDNNISQIYTDVTTKVPLEYYLGDGREALKYNLAWGWLPEIGSYIAVSIHQYQNNIYDNSIEDDRKYTILKDDLVARVGKTILIFKVSELTKLPKNK